MGLDMYLYVKKEIYPYDYAQENGTTTRKDNPMFDRVIESAEMKNLPSAEYGTVRVDKCVGYWRKANAVHGWIVRNCANGVDECQRITMSLQDIKKLRDACVKELANRGNASPDGEDTKAIQVTDNGSNAESVIQGIMSKIQAESAKAHTTVVLDDPLELVPTEGFFFGSNSKDEYYYHTIEYTLDLMNSLLAYANDDDYIYYEASW